VRIACLAFGFWILALSAPYAAETDEEHHLVGILQSSSSPHDKDAACARLKRVGTKDCIPALSLLLTDEQLSHSARYALESLPGPEADRALIAALNRSSGLTKVGIINSIGLRADKSALPPLKKLLDDQDPAVAAAAARALSYIADPAVLKALMAAMHKSTGEAHHAQVQACLQSANNVIYLGQPEQARAAFATIYESEKSPGSRVAAFRGILRTSGKKSGGLFLRAVAGEPGPARTAALQMLHETDFGIAGDLPRLLPSLTPDVQVALLDGLTQSSNPSAVDLARPSIASTNAEVRLAAIRCLGSLGDTSAIPLLARSAASASGPERAAAQDALVRLHGRGINDGLFAQLRTADPETRAEVARALGQRGDTNAIPALLDSAHGESDSVRPSVLQALGFLARQPHVGAMVQLVVDARTDETRSEAAEALNSVLQRLLSGRGHVDCTPLTQAIGNSTPESRVALLGLCGGLKDPQIRDALRSSVRDSNPQVRAAAIRAMCDTTDSDLLQDLLTIARTDTDEKLRTLAIGACVRLLTQEETVKIPNAARVEALKGILASPLDVPQKRLVLSGLAEIPDVESLTLAESLLDDAAVQPEAIRAVMKIATTVPAAQAEPAREALNHILRLPIDDDMRKTATAALIKMKPKAEAKPTGS
jgi:HEAT repeat protein